MIVPSGSTKVLQDRFQETTVSSFEWFWSNSFLSLIYRPVSTKVSETLVFVSVRSTLGPFSCLYGRLLQGESKRMAPGKDVTWASTTTMRRSLNTPRLETEWYTDEVKEERRFHLSPVGLTWKRPGLRLVTLWDPVEVRPYSFSTQLDRSSGWS